jgi:hypothetical protein
MKKNNEEEVGIRELIIKIIEWKKYLMSKWKIILALGLTGGILGFTYASFQKKVYEAELSYALEEKGSSLSSYAGIASQFGFDLGKGDGGAFSGDNILELIKSRLIIERTLLTEVSFNGKKDLLVNRYIESNKIKLKNKEEIRYAPQQPREQYSILQDSVLNFIYTRIVKYDLTATRLDKKMVIFNIKVSSEDELFAKIFTELLVKNVSEFYIQTKTKKIRANIVLLENKIDSVKSKLDTEMYGAAQNQDENQNSIRAQVRIPLAKKQISVQLLTTLYGELVKNAELSKLTLMREEPLIQIIDRPILPLKYKKPGRFFFFLGGGFFFCFFLAF